MLLHFYKFNASGCDFILIDNRRWTVELGRHTVAWLCDRRSGIGADGVVMLEPGRDEDSGASYRMVQYDPSGRERLCSVHALRCFAEFTSALTGEERVPLLVERPEGGTVLVAFKGDMVHLTLSIPENYCFKVVTVRGLPGSRLCLVDTHTSSISVPVADVRVLNVTELGGAMRKDGLLTAVGANVHFVQIVQPGVLAVRSYDARMHHEVPCPGEGILAVSLNALRTESWVGNYRIIVSGGEEIGVSPHKNAEHGNLESVTISGYASFVYSGEIEIPEVPEN